MRRNRRGWAWYYFLLAFVLLLALLFVLLIYNPFAFSEKRDLVRLLPPGMTAHLWIKDVAAKIQGVRESPFLRKAAQSKRLQSLLAVPEVRAALQECGLGDGWSGLAASWKKMEEQGLTEERLYEFLGDEIALSVNPGNSRRETAFVFLAKVREQGRFLASLAFACGPFVRLPEGSLGRVGGLLVLAHPSLPWEALYLELRGNLLAISTRKELLSDWRRQLREENPGWPVSEEMLAQERDLYLAVDFSRLDQAFSLPNPRTLTHPAVVVWHLLLAGFSLPALRDSVHALSFSGSKLTWKMRVALDNKAIPQAERLMQDQPRQAPESLRGIPANAFLVYHLRCPLPEYLNYFIGALGQISLPDFELGRLIEENINYFQQQTAFRDQLSALGNEITLVVCPNPDEKIFPPLPMAALMLKAVDEIRLRQFLSYVFTSQREFLELKKVTTFPLFDQSQAYEPRISFLLLWPQALQPTVAATGSQVLLASHPEFVRAWDRMQQGAGPSFRETPLGKSLAGNSGQVGLSVSGAGVADALARYQDEWAYSRFLSRARQVREELDARLGRLSTDDEFTQEKKIQLEREKERLGRYVEWVRLLHSLEWNVHLEKEKLGTRLAVSFAL